MLDQSDQSIYSGREKNGWIKVEQLLVGFPADNSYIPSLAYVANISPLSWTSFNLINLIIYQKKEILIAG